MYDLPSENLEEPGLPDEFHDLQPQLLSATLRLHSYASNQIFTGTDLNLYYNVRHSHWYKRPDWFLVVGVPRFYDDHDLRSSYVLWQEGVSPFVIVELLSPGTEKEDLGPYVESAEQSPLDSRVDTKVDSRSALSPGEATTPPRKWEVYEQILRVPYYIVFSRYTNQIRFFQLVGGHYQEQPLDPKHPRIWIPELELGIGLWQGEFNGVTRPWLRWYDSEENWIPTDAERTIQALERAEQAEAQLQQVALNLLQQGMTVEQVAQLVGLSVEQVQQLADMA